MFVCFDVGMFVCKTFYLPRWNIFVCLDVGMFVYLLNSLLVEMEYICSIALVHVAPTFSIYHCSQHFSKFSKEKEEREDFSEEEDGGEKEKSAASIKKVSFFKRQRKYS